MTEKEELFQEFVDDKNVLIKDPVIHNKLRGMAESIMDATLCDDIFFRFVANYHPEVLKEIIDIVLGRNITIAQSSVEAFVNAFPGLKEYFLDSLILSTEDLLCGIDMQKYPVDPQRFVLYSYMLACSDLRKGKAGWNTKDIYVIVFLKDGIIKHGVGVNQIKIPEAIPYSQTEVSLTDISQKIPHNVKVLFINGKYKNNDKIGDLIQSLQEPVSEKIRNQVIRNAVESIKTSKGRNMYYSYLMDRYPDLAQPAIQFGEQIGLQKGISLSKYETARSLLSFGDPIEKIKQVTGLPEDEIQNIKNELTDVDGSCFK